jgi:orotate phosphoribosyltransferase
VKVVALVDRLEGAKEKLEKLGYSFEPLFTVQDLDTSN